MGLKKASTNGVEKAVDNGHSATGSKETQPGGTNAAVDRLTTPKTSETVNKAYKPRDFDAEARGKTRCATFAAALQSPGIAGMRFKTMEEYLALVKQAADYAVAYSFDEIK